MTTRITIKNEDDSKHEVQLKYIGYTTSLAPGESWTSHLWAENTITLKELPLGVTNKKPLPPFGNVGLDEPEHKFALGARLEPWPGNKAE